MIFKLCYIEILVVLLKCWIIECLVQFCDHCYRILISLIIATWYIQYSSLTIFVYINILNDMILFNDMCKCDYELKDFMLINNVGFCSNLFFLLFVYLLIRGGVSPTLTVTRYWTANFSLFKLFVKVAAADKE